MIHLLWLTVYNDNYEPMDNQAIYHSKLTQGRVVSWTPCDEFSKWLHIKRSSFGMHAAFG